MAGTHFPIGIGNQIGKIGSKKGPESGILRNSVVFRPEFPTKVVGGVGDPVKDDREDKEVACRLYHRLVCV